MVGSKLSDIIETYSPSACGLAVSLLTLLTLKLLNISVPAAFVSSMGSLVTQVLATYLGLVLTSYAILHAIKFEPEKGRPELRTEIQVVFNQLHGTFATTVKWLAMATLLVFGIYVAAALADLPEIRARLPGWGLLRWAMAFTVGAMTYGSVEIVCAVKTLFNLRSI